MGKRQRRSDWAHRPGKEHPKHGERPAIIVHKWGNTLESAVQLQVFLDTDKDGRHNDGGGVGPLEWATSVLHGNGASQYHFATECAFIERPDARA